MRTEALTTIGAAVMGLIAAAPAGATPPTMEFDTYRMSSSRASLTVPAPGVVSNDFDEVESDLVFARLLRPTHKGTLDLHPDGSFSYTRNPGAVGRDRFVYLYPRHQ